MRHDFQTGDVQDILRGQPENSFDACLTDPPYGLGFMGKAWDKGVPSADVWRDVYRVLKPGAMMLAFGGTRTFHRLTCAIEDAGFEIRDCLMWLYGSGFPKSLDIGKALPTWDGYGTALKPAWEPIILAMKPLDGTFADNALKHGVAGLHIAAGRIATEDNLNGGRYSDGKKGDDGNAYGTGLNLRSKEDYVQPDGRWPANLLLDEEAAAQMDAQSGTLKSGGGNRRPNGAKGGVFNSGFGSTDSAVFAGDSGGASRFFYVAKAGTKERGAGNNHPTVKPTKLDTELARYLLTLVLPPARENGERRLLVPFSGSGSELLGARNAGWEYALGIDNNPDYVSIAEGRLAA